MSCIARVYAVNFFSSNVSFPDRLILWEIIFFTIDFIENAARCSLKYLADVMIEAVVYFPLASVVRVQAYEKARL